MNAYDAAIKAKNDQARVPFLQRIERVSIVERPLHVRLDGDEPALWGRPQVPQHEHTLGDLSSSLVRFDFADKKQRARWLYCHLTPESLSLAREVCVPFAYLDLIRRIDGSALLLARAGQIIADRYLWTGHLSEVPEEFRDTFAQWVRR